jgi:hypothetical protein
MKQRTGWTRLLVAVSISSLMSAGIPAQSPTGPAALSGTVRSSRERPLAGVRVYAAHPESGRITTSQPSGEDGSFAIPALAPGSYEIGVAIGERLYLGGQPVALRPGSEQRVSLAVQTDADGGSAPSAASVAAAKPVPSVWNNPLSAALIVVGSAVVVGVLVESATDDEDLASPM